MMKTMIVTLLSLYSFGAFAAKAEKQTFDSANIKTISIENTSGTVKITGSSAAKSTVSIEKVKFNEKCSLEVTNKSSTLKILVEQKVFALSGCEVNIILDVPSTANLKVENGSGNIEVTNLNGDVDYTLGNGNVKINCDVSKIIGKTGNGTTTLKGSFPNAELNSGNGNVSVTYTAAPDKGNIDIKSGNGNTTVFFPTSSKIQAELASGMGSTSNELGTSRDAKFKVSLNSGLGNVNIKKF